MTSATHPNAGPPAWVTKQRRPVAAGAGDGDVVDQTECVRVREAAVVGEPDGGSGVVAVPEGEAVKLDVAVRMLVAVAVGVGELVAVTVRVTLGVKSNGPAGRQGRATPPPDDNDAGTLV